MIWGSRLREACRQAATGKRTVRYSLHTDEGDDFIVTVSLRKNHEDHALTVATYMTSQLAGAVSQSS